MVLERFYIHTAQVETYAGRTGSGVESYAAAVAKAGFMDDERRMVLSETGEQVVSSSTWYTSLDDVALYPLKTKVTVNSYTGLVLGVKRRDGGALGLPDHLEVALT